MFRFRKRRVVEKKECGFDNIDCLVEKNYGTHSNNNKFTISFRYKTDSEGLGHIDLFLRSCFKNGWRGIAYSLTKQFKSHGYKYSFKKNITEEDDHFTKVQEYNKKLAEFFNTYQKNLLNKPINKGSFFVYKINKIEYIRSNVYTSAPDSQCEGKTNPECIYFEEMNSQGDSSVYERQTEHKDTKPGYYGINLFTSNRGRLSCFGDFPKMVHFLHNFFNENNFLDAFGENAFNNENVGGRRRRRKRSNTKKKKRSKKKSRKRKSKKRRRRKTRRKRKY